MAAAVREGGNDRRASERAARKSDRGGEPSSAARKQRSRPPTYKGATGGVFKNAAVHVLRHERRLMSTGEVTKTAVRMGFIGSLPGKTPEATMASALYTDIKRWKAGIPGSVFCRPKEGLFGLREWASDPELAPLVASERAFEDAPRAARDGDRSGGVSKLRGSSWSDGSDASARSDALVRDASADASCAGRPAKRRGKKSAGPAASSGKEEGLRLLLDAATGAGGVDDAEERCEAAAAAAAKDEPSSRTEPPNDPFRVGSDASLDRARAPSAEGIRVDEREAPTRAGAGAGARGDASALASAPPSASDAAAAEARRQSLDGVVAALSARCAELYVLLGPHELVVRDLAELVLALRIGGARYALQEKTVTEMLWELARAVAFPGGFGETAEMLAVLARIVAGIIDNAAVRATASIAEAEAASARREREALARAALSAAGASARGADAGDEAAASKLLASLQNSLDRGASASASAYAALAAASGGTGVARTTPPTPRAE